MTNRRISQMIDRDRDPGYLQGNVAAVIHDLGADLDQLISYGSSAIKSCPAPAASAWAGNCHDCGRAHHEAGEVAR
jgi:hypothetical protein